MKSEELNKIIEQLECGASKEKATFGFYYLEGEAVMHIKANKDGFELFVSDHFGVMTAFQFKNADSMGGKRRKRKFTFKRHKKNKKFLTRRK